MWISEFERGADMRLSQVAIRQEELIAWAKAEWPEDRLAFFADVLHGILGWALMPFILLVPISTFLLGLLNIVSFGLSGLIFNIPWFLLLGVMLGSSWLWLKLPLARPLLLIPGVIFAALSSLYAAYMPEMGEWEARAVKQALCNCWPRSILLMTGSVSKGQEL